MTRSNLGTKFPKGLTLVRTKYSATQNIGQRLTLVDEVNVQFYCVFHHASNRAQIIWISLCLFFWLSIMPLQWWFIIALFIKWIEGQLAFKCFFFVFFRGTFHNIFKLDTRCTFDCIGTSGKKFPKPPWESVFNLLV